MTARTTLPGYTGYVPRYQEEYPLNKAVNTKRYADYTVEPAHLINETPWRTLYDHTLDPVKRVIPVRKPDRTHLVRQQFEQTLADRDTARMNRDKYEYEEQPASAWGSTYKSNFNAHQTHANAGPRRSIHRPYGDMPSSNVGGAGGRSQALSRAPIGSSYQKSYGRLGDNPRTRYVEGDGKQVFSRRATSKDLFFGTTKSSTRIPGYSGHVPGHEMNRSMIRDDCTVMERSLHKDNLTAIYRHNIPGYTGHAPQAMVNRTRYQATHPRSR